MTPKQRAARIEAAAANIFDSEDPTRFSKVDGQTRGEYLREAERALDAADLAAPVVDVEQHLRLRRLDQSDLDAQYRALRGRAERAEAAARDFAKTLKGMVDMGADDFSPYEATYVEWAQETLARHPDYTEERP